MQRLRLKFSRGDGLKYISHLDLMRCWERVLCRASIPMVYSEGFNPRPRLSLAAPLAVGVTSDCELMDIFLERWLSPEMFMRRVTPQLPLGLDVLEVAEMSLSLPSLQSQLRSIEYRVEVETTRGREEIQTSLESLLRAEHLPWQHTRNTTVRRYDLRVLVNDVWLIELVDSLCILGMRLLAGQQGTGRPEQVTTALGFASLPHLINRARLILAGDKSS